MEPRASSPPTTTQVERKFHVLVGVTGSVAALKLPLLVLQLLDIPGVTQPPGPSLEVVFLRAPCSGEQVPIHPWWPHLPPFIPGHLVTHPPQSHGEVKWLHLAGPDLWVTAEVRCANMQATELEVTVVTTERAKHFYSPQDIPVTVYSDTDEWEMWKHRSDPVLHIDLRRWADLMVVAPLDANTLGKVASGICDNLLTCVIRAWDPSKPLLFCPAMNTAMWEHPITAQQVGQLKIFGYTEVPCIAKKLVCGDEGMGAMAEVETIVDKVKEVLSQHHGIQQS